MVEEKRQNAQDESQGTGRTSNIDGSSKAGEARDISDIDRQEGEMDHGETGGNFRSAEAADDNASRDQSGAGR